MHLLTDTFDIIESVYQKKREWVKKMKETDKKGGIDDAVSDKDSLAAQDKRLARAKYRIFDEIEFNRGRQVLGNLIVHGMITSGGTDVDWMIEHKGCFIIFEFKSFHNDKINVPKGQMIAYERLYQKLNSASKCYLYIIGCDEIDFSDPESPIWIFELKQWENGAIPKNAEGRLGEEGEESTKHHRYVIFRDFMDEIKVTDLRDMLDRHWKEFEDT